MISKIETRITNAFSTVVSNNEELCYLISKTLIRKFKLTASKDTMIVDVTVTSASPINLVQVSYTVLDHSSFVLSAQGTCKTSRHRNFHILS